MLRVVQVEVVLVGTSFNVLCDHVLMPSRRRRETGQLSKGAIRAQRSQARAKQMRQNLLGTNLLNISLYNAQHGHTHTSRGLATVPTHPGQQYIQHHMDNNGYLPIGMNGMYGNEGMYRLPPLDGYGGQPMPIGYEGWEGHPPAQMGMGQYGYGGWEGSGMVQPEYGMGNEMLHPQIQDAYYPLPAHEPFDPYAQNVGVAEYQLPPILEPSHGETASMGMGQSHTDSMEPPRQGTTSNTFEMPKVPPIESWVTNEGQQTPSGHVGFNERLFDGALGSAGLQDLGREEGLSAFDEAVAQASDW
jgi:hypothetical protein